MPGLTFMMTDEGRTCNNCDPSKHRPCYSMVHTIAPTQPGRNPASISAGSAYDEYPVRVFSGAGYLIYLEGRIYNRPAASVEADLAEIADTALGPAHDDAGVERFILANEGSYVVVVVRPGTGEVLLFTDAFCRLPLYYSVDESRLIVARDAKFVHALRAAPGFDRVGCAQFLAFGLPLGDRTVLEGVRSFPDAGLLRANVVGGRLRWRLRTLREWNLDEEDGSKSRRRAGGRICRPIPCRLPQLGLARRQPGEPGLAERWPRFASGCRRAGALGHGCRRRQLSRS